MDLLTDPAVHGYTIGTSNILFQQKKQLADVFIDAEAGTIETAHPEIRRQLQLTTEDLRFVDYVLRHVQSPRESAEGSEQWIRAQFGAYVVAMLRTVLQQERLQERRDQELLELQAAATVQLATDAAAAAAAAAGDGGAANGERIEAAAAATTMATMTANSSSSSSTSKDCEHFNGFFVAELLQTPGWREWRDSFGVDGGDGGEGDGNALQRFEDEVAVGHPFAGTLSVADMKLKLAQ